MGVSARSPPFAQCARFSSPPVQGILPSLSPVRFARHRAQPQLSPRCPHVKEVCRNKSAHPRIDVVYLKNAEGESNPLSTAERPPDYRISSNLQRVRLLQGSTQIVNPVSVASCSDVNGFRFRPPSILFHNVTQASKMVNRDGQDAADRLIRRRSNLYPLLTGRRSVWSITSLCPRRSKLSSILSSVPLPSGVLANPRHSLSPL